MNTNALINNLTANTNYAFSIRSVNIANNITTTQVLYINVKTLLV